MEVDATEVIWVTSLFSRPMECSQIKNSITIQCTAQTGITPSFDVTCQYIIAYSQHSFVGAMMPLLQWTANFVIAPMAFTFIHLPMSPVLMERASFEPKIVSCSALALPKTPWLSRFLPTIPLGFFIEVRQQAS